MRTYHHNSNSFLLESDINITFDELYLMSNEDFAEWILTLRERVKTSWIDHNQPPTKTISDDAIIRQFQRLVDTPTDDCLVINGLNQRQELLNPKLPISAANPFFPNMAKSKDITSLELTGLSTWDYFVEGENLEQMTRGLRRNLKWDSFYHFAPIIFREQEIGLGAKNGSDWVKRFRKADLSGYDFYVEYGPSKRTRGMSPLSLTAKSLTELVDAGLIHDIQTKNLNDRENIPSKKGQSNKNQIRIRVYKKNQSIFPHFFDCLRKGLVAQGTNYPAILSKYVYSHYTSELKDQDRIVIYDPSSGYGGRLLGALSLNQDRQLHYVGTDPNPDNFIESLGISRYEYLARFFNNNIRGKHRTTYEVFQKGSEVVGADPNFQKYKGKVDLIFTSPPYFAAEGYSEDENQSFKKFPTYSEWRDGFLTETLRTCVEYLKPERYLLWNIADVNFNGRYFPLENDSYEILLSLGMEFKTRLKMMLSGVPQISKRLRAPSSKNYCAYNNKYRKYEPVFVFYKNK
jgi:hypothetical protein